MLLLCTLDVQHFLQTLNSLTRNFVNVVQVYRADRARWAAAQKWLAALAQTDASPIETPDIIDECSIRLSVVPWRGETLETDSEEEEAEGTLLLVDQSQFLG